MSMINEQSITLIRIIPPLVKFALSNEEELVSQIKESLYLTAANELPYQSVITTKSDKLIILFPLKSNPVLGENVRVAEKLHKLFLREVPEVTTTIGVGNICNNLTEIRKCYIEALDAIKIGRAIFGRNRVISYLDLGIYQLLPSLRENPSLTILFTDWLGKIIDHDRDKGSDLLKTLEIYLETNCDVQETAARLFIHRNTLRYRLDKLAELTDGKLANPENRLHYLLSIKIWRLSK